MVAHASQLHAVPDDMTDEAAVIVEPTACAVHAALRRPDHARATPSSSSAPAPSACSRSPPSATSTPAGTIVAAASYPHQRALAARARRRPGRASRASCPASSAGSPARWPIGDQLTGGATSSSTASAPTTRSPQALAIVRPRGTVVVVGMPGQVKLDLTALWHRETELVGAYAYGTETLPDGERPRARSTSPSSSSRRPTSAGWSSATYPLADYKRRHRPRRLRRPPGRGEGRLRPPRRRRSGTADAPTRLRPRGRPLDAAAPVLARRGLQPRAAARRAHPRHLPARAARRRSRTSTAPSATPCSTRSTAIRCRPCCSRA